MVLSNDQQKQKISNQESPSAIAVGKRSWLRLITLCIGGIFAVVLTVLYGLNRTRTNPSGETILFSIRRYYVRLVFWFLSLTSVSRIHTIIQPPKIIEYENFVMDGGNWTVTDAKSISFITGIHRDSRTTNVHGIPRQMPDGLNNYVLFQRPVNDTQHWSVNLTRNYSVVVPTYTYRLQFWYTTSTTMSLQVMLNGVVTASLLPSSSSAITSSWVLANTSTVVAQSSSLIAKFSITSSLSNATTEAIAISGIALWDMGIREHDHQQTRDMSSGPTTMHMGMETTHEQLHHQTIEQQQQQQQTQQTIVTQDSGDCWWLFWFWCNTGAGSPSTAPTTPPSQAPTTTPSMVPSIQPSCQPTVQPSRQPTQQPTARPSGQPTRQPTRYDCLIYLSLSAHFLWEEYLFSILLHQRFFSPSFIPFSFPMLCVVQTTIVSAIKTTNDAPIIAAKSATDTTAIVTAIITARLAPNNAA